MDFAFLDTIPLSPHQREYVVACWEQYPENERPQMQREKLIGNIRKSGFFLMLVIGALIWRQPVAVGLALLVVWCLFLAIMIGGPKLLAYCQDFPETKASSRRRPWKGFNVLDKIITRRGQLRYLIPRGISFEYISGLTWSILLLVTLVVTRHWLTAVAWTIAISSAVVCLAIFKRMAKNYIQNRARAYAVFANLEPEIDPSQINPDHPRPVLN